MLLSMNLLFWRVKNGRRLVFDAFSWQIPEDRGPPDDVPLRSQNGKKGVQMTKRVHSEKLTKQLNEALQPEGIPGAVALVTTKEQVII